MENMSGEQIFSSWSGGKDSCLALYYALQDGALPRCLFTMFSEDGERTRSHGLDHSVVRAQAEALSLPLVVGRASWNDYESVFLKALRGFKKEGVSGGVFGDIDLEPHRQWVERVCGEVSITPCLPLWKQGRHELLSAFVGLGFKATIIAVKEEVLSRSFLGRELDGKTVADLERAGIDPSGEEGEYHTVVTDGPIFSKPIFIQPVGTCSREGYAFLVVQHVKKSPHEEIENYG